MPKLELGQKWQFTIIIRDFLVKTSISTTATVFSTLLASVEKAM
jgi:hypothetical protein